MGSSSRERADGEGLALLRAKDRARAERLAAQQAQQYALPDYIPQASRSTLVVGNAPTMSVRERAERAAAQEPEVLTTPRTAAGSTGFDGPDNIAHVSVRERAERQATLARTEQTPRWDADADAWYEYEMNRRREAEAKEQERERKQAERIAQEQAQQKAEGERQLWLVSVNSVFDTLQATDAERARVLALPTVQVGDNPDKLGGILLTLRAAHNNAPAWAAWAGLKKN